jgi:hydrogenase/urease accessory protein HupE
MLEAWLFRGMIWALSCRSVIRVKQHPPCWRSLNPTMRRARFFGFHLRCTRHTVGATRSVLVPVDHIDLLACVFAIGLMAFLALGL